MDEWYAQAKERKLYDDPATGKIAAAFLNQKNILTVEDWGCGYGGFKEFFGDHKTYIGIDVSQSPFAEKIVDLEK